jgi:hypothetical protein
MKRLSIVLVAFALLVPALPAIAQQIGGQHLGRQLARPRGKHSG